MKSIAIPFLHIFSSPPLCFSFKDQFNPFDTRKGYNLKTRSEIIVSTLCLKGEDKDAQARRARAGHAAVAPSAPRADVSHVLLSPASTLPAGLGFSSTRRRCRTLCG